MSWIEQSPQEKQQREEEERKQKEEEERLNYVNKNLSDIKVDGKDEDKDSGLKIDRTSSVGLGFTSVMSGDSGPVHNIPGVAPAW